MCTQCPISSRIRRLKEARLLVYITNVICGFVRAATIERNSCEEASAAILREQY
jgi:hypothetical protein